VFATTSYGAGDIPPFELKYDKISGESPKIGDPYRVQSAKQAEIPKQVTVQLDTGIIEPSQASLLPQVIPASKPNDAWSVLH
jgi:hypothetical protein